MRCGIVQYRQILRFVQTENEASCAICMNLTAGPFVFNSTEVSCELATNAPTVCVWDCVCVCLCVFVFTSASE